MTAVTTLCQCTFFFSFKTCYLKINRSLTEDDKTAVTFQSLTDFCHNSSGSFESWRKWLMSQHFVRKGFPILHVPWCYLEVSYQEDDKTVVTSYGSLESYRWEWLLSQHLLCQSSLFFSTIVEVSLFRRWLLLSQRQSLYFE